MVDDLILLFATHVEPSAKLADFFFELFDLALVRGQARVEFLLQRVAQCFFDLVALSCVSRRLPAIDQLPRAAWIGSSSISAPISAFISASAIAHRFALQTTIWRNTFAWQRWLIGRLPTLTLCRHDRCQ